MSMNNIVLAATSTRCKKLVTQEIDFSKALTSLKVHLLRGKCYGS